MHVCQASMTQRTSYWEGPYVDSLPLHCKTFLRQCRCRSCRCVTRGLTAQETTEIHNLVHRSTLGPEQKRLQLASLFYLLACFSPKSTVLPFQDTHWMDRAQFTQEAGRIHVPPQAAVACSITKHLVVSISVRWDQWVSSSGRVYYCCYLNTFLIWMTVCSLQFLRIKKHSFCALIEGEKE